MYLIVDCEELNDQWECDAKRVPLCITEDCSPYGFGYEIYKIEEDGKVTLIKEYEKALEEGIALYWWKDDEEELNSNTPNIIHKFSGMRRDEVTNHFIETLLNESGFEESIEDILIDIHQTGQHGEQVNNRWVVIGEYFDSDFSIGY